MPTATLNTRGIQGESLNAASDRLLNSTLLEEGVVDRGGVGVEKLGWHVPEEARMLKS